MTTTVKPRNVVTGPMYLCSSRPRRCERVTTLRCTACGWWGADPQPGEALDLFAEPEHPDAECVRRQTDPQYRWDQDNARMIAAGLPAPPRPRLGSDRADKQM